MENTQKKQKYRILAIDDNLEILNFIESALSAKYEVLTSSSGEEALVLCGECDPDLVILDVKMPDLSGFEICRAIRKMPGKGNLPIIMLSALDSPNDQRSGYKEGANFYITKPVTPERLLRNVEIQLNSAGPPCHKKSTLSQIKTQKVRQEQKAAAEVKPKPSPPPPTPKPISPKSSRPRILVVDDDLDILRMMQLVFQDDYELITSDNGPDAIRKVTAYEPDILILDIMIPKVNGFQICLAVRKLERLAALPIIFLTGRDDPKLQEMSKRLNALHLLKPIQAHVLMREVKEALKLSPFLDEPKRFTYDQIQTLESLAGV